MLQLLCRTHELELENMELQASGLRRGHLLDQKDLVIQRYQQHRLLCEDIIQGQRQLIQGEATPPAACAWTLRSCFLQRVGSACASPQTRVLRPSRRQQLPALQPCPPMAPSHLHSPWDMSSSGASGAHLTHTQCLAFARSPVWRRNV